MLGVGSRVLGVGVCAFFFLFFVVILLILVIVVLVLTLRLPFELLAAAHLLDRALLEAHDPVHLAEINGIKVVKRVLALVSYNTHLQPRRFLHIKSAHTHMYSVFRCTASIAL